MLLTQSPYKSTDPKAGDNFVQHGYIYVTAYVRGTTTSGGSFGFFSDRDAQDGAELVDWAAHRLPGSNGTVGLHGGSYAGINQMFTTVAAGPGSPIKAMLAACMGAEFYRETYFAGGIPTQTLNFQRVIGDAMGGDTAAAGAANVADIEAGGDKAYFRDFWKQRTVGELAQKVVDTGVPTMLWSSDGDIYAQSSLELYAYFQNAYAKAPVYGPMSAATPASGRYQIIMSQGGHCENEDPNIQLEWFDTWLKGVPTGMDKTSTPIHVDEMISNRWINTSHYPVTPTYTTYYLGASNELGTEAPRGGAAKNARVGGAGREQHRHLRRTGARRGRHPGRPHQRNGLRVVVRGGPGTAGHRADRRRRRAGHHRELRDRTREHERAGSRSLLVRHRGRPGTAVREVRQVDTPHARKCQQVRFRDLAEVRRGPAR